MKKLAIVCLFSFFTAAAFAQTSDKMMNDKKDCIMMKDGKMMVMKGGMSMMMMNDTTIHGTMVMKDGSYKMKDGKMHMLKDGECIMPSGKMKMMKMDKMSSGGK